MLVNTELTLEEAVRTIRALETVPMMTTTEDLDVRRCVRDKLANAVNKLIRDDASGEALRHLESLSGRIK